MIITDYSNQDFTHSNPSKKDYYFEIITAGTIFIAPILFLLLISSL